MPNDAQANSSARPVAILFAGGGTGGHIFPNMAVIERLQDHARAAGLTVEPHLLVSDRAIDADILLGGPHAYSALPVKPLPRHPLKWPRFYLAWRAGVRQVRRLIRSQRPAALVATGGFVSGPAVVAARRARVPVLLLNLDAVPGRANRAMARRATEVMTVYPTPVFPGARRIGLPLRHSALPRPSPEQARQELGLEPGRPTLLVTGASQGAQSINQMMSALLDLPETRAALGAWQVLHLAGHNEQIDLAGFYREAGVPARVMPFLDQMGLAWSAADLAISRAGAGSVAEVWASATPAIFLPYPYHKDQHQRHNALPLVEAGGAMLRNDLIDPTLNAVQLAGPLTHLMADADRRAQMRHSLEMTQPPDGAEVAARWLMARMGMEGEEVADRKVEEDMPSDMGAD